ncbi:hypothetical protein TREMEDRAFT_59195 [Tremella mesenterica DSM 1558]|uniref:uncharacterized protein n=1 Tax=Tremella mesenterica (strain ATCC 24925 / CBS 8224 / DSM 1558 / NBRC 9311 / NRRL Y-6157 / RJB 2259-6 / UBC 559-6) TaxID=578456 RepID=UPI0003F4A5A9|nr:uncharacterized protein TREMEDRAFT_59195 [Tremella mesenterica DSM 1558]EIW73030.1 hypothetical protein TREMEDRAFT_59195 [Tremella mesenterica DSM 1558]
MPVYKKVEKRLAKKEKEDASGLTQLRALVKEELGEDESSSSSASSSTDTSDSEDNEDNSGDDDSEEEEREGEEKDLVEQKVGEVEENVVKKEEQKIGEKRKRREGSKSFSSDSESDSESDSDSQEEEEEDVDEEEGEKNGSEDGDGFSMSIDDVAKDPLYDDELGRKSCVVCPGKALKNEKMITLHLKSGGHTRAMKRWNKIIKSPRIESFQTQDPREIVEEIQRGIRGEKMADGLKPLKPWRNPAQKIIDPESLKAIREARKLRLATKREEKRKRKEVKLQKKLEREKNRPAKTKLSKEELREKRRRKRMKKEEGMERVKGRSPRNVRREQRALKMLRTQDSGWGQMTKKD